MTRLRVESAAVRWALVACLTAETLAAGGCAMMGGFDFGGYSAAPDGTGAADALPREDHSLDEGDAAPRSAGEAASTMNDSSPAVGSAVDASPPASEQSEAGATSAPDVDAFDASPPDATIGTDARPTSDADAQDRPDVYGHDAPNDGTGDTTNDGCTSDGPSCGACGHGCQGGACLVGQCQPLILAAATAPLGLAITDSAVLWVEGSAVKSVPPAGGMPSIYTSTSSSLSGSLVVDTTNAYWSVGDQVETAFLGGPGGGWSFDPISDAISTLTSLAVDNLPASSIWTPRPANLYVVRHMITTQGGGCATEAIDIAPLMRGGSVTSWTTGVCNVVRMASDIAYLYWTDTGTGNSYTHPAVWRHAVGSMTAEALAAAQAPFGIGVYGGKVYWTDANAGVMQYDLASSITPVTLAKVSGARDMAVDGSGVYWIEQQGGQSTIRTVPLAGGEPRTLAVQSTDALAIATNASGVFWLSAGSQDQNFTNGAVMKVAK